MGWKVIEILNRLNEVIAMTESRADKYLRHGQNRVRQDFELIGDYLNIIKQILLLELETIDREEK